MRRKILGVTVTKKKRLKEREKLGDYLVRMGLSQSVFAAELGVTREAVRGWVSGEYFPTLSHIAQMELKTGGAISARSFYTDKMMEDLDTRGVGNG